MTWEEIIDFIKANEATHERLIPCVLAKDQGGNWSLCVGETQSDGVFRHVDFRIDNGLVEPALAMLRRASPEDRAALQDAIAQ